MKGGHGKVAGRMTNERVVRVWWFFNAVENECDMCVLSVRDMMAPPGTVRWRSSWDTRFVSTRPVVSAADVLQRADVAPP